MAVPALPLIIALEGLTKTLNGIKDQFKAAMDFADKAQKSSLALGRTYEQTRKDLGGTMQGLRGDITQKFQAGIAGMEEGLQGNTAGIARLINQQQLTGTSFANTAKSMAKLESSLGLSRDQTNVLANSLIATSQTWNISTDKLVDAIDALTATFPAQDLAGMGDKVVGAVANLQAELGPQLAGPLNAVMKAVMDTSQEGYASLVRMGIGDIRERLSAAKNQEEALKILKEGIQTAANNVKIIAGGADKFFGQIGVAQRVMGAASLDFTTVAKNFGARVGEEQKAARDFGKTLENLKNEILAPFQDFLAGKLYPIFIDVADGLSAMATKVVSAFSSWLDETIPDGKSAFQKITLYIVDFVTIGLNKLGYFFDEFQGGLMSARQAFHWGIIVPLESVLIAFNLLKSYYLILGTALSSLVGVIAWAVEKVGGFLGFDVDLAKQVKEVSLSLASKQMDMIKDNAKSISESVKNIATSPEEAQKNFEERLANSLKDPKALGNRLLGDIRADILAGNGIRREGNASLEEAKKRLASVDNKTPEIRSNSSFLRESTESIESTLQRIIGVKSGDNSDELIKTLQKQIEIQTETLENQKKATEYADISNRLIAVQSTQTVGIKNQSGGRKN